MKINIKKFIKNNLAKFLIASLATGIVAVSVVPMASASEVRDWDTNAIIYGGAYTVDQLNYAINHGTKYQTSAELKTLYDTLGMNQSNLTTSKLKNGYFYRDGHVTVDGKTVATGALSMGRHITPNSIPVKIGDHTVYWRPPSDSFASGTTSIPAFVYMNYDNTMAFAISKSCGNPVKGVGVKTLQKYNLEIRKWNDLNGDNHKQANEPYLSGWEFKVRGPNVDRTVITNANGSAVISGIIGGNYTVDEVQKPGWVTVTNPHRVVFVSANTVIYFGNRKQEAPRYSVTVKKFNDTNADKTRQSSEAMLANWRFTLKGTNVTQIVTTDKNGNAVIPNLLPGTYTVTETQQTGWTSTTGLVKTVTITGANQTVWFGNRKIPITPSSTFGIVAKKYEDINGNKVHDANEPWLKGWNIKLTGNNLNREFLTDGDGTVNFSNLPAGKYTVSEVMQSGWKNTTAISQEVVLPDPNTLNGYVEFGNQKIIPITPSGTVAPTPTTTTLPSAGPAEAAAGTFGLLGVSGASIYLRKSKLALLTALKKF